MIFCNMQKNVDISGQDIIISNNTDYSFSKCEDKCHDFLIIIFFY